MGLAFGLVCEEGLGLEWDLRLYGEAGLALELELGFIVPDVFDFGLGLESEETLRLDEGNGSDWILGSDTTFALEGRLDFGCDSDANLGLVLVLVLDIEERL